MASADDSAMLITRVDFAAYTSDNTKDAEYKRNIKFCDGSDEAVWFRSRDPEDTEERQNYIASPCLLQGIFMTRSSRAGLAALKEQSRNIQMVCDTFPQLVCTSVTRDDAYEATWQVAVSAIAEKFATGKLV